MAHATDHQVDRTVVTIELDGAPDERGRHNFMMWWWDDHHHSGPQWRGQCFHTVVRPHVLRWHAVGRAVRITLKGRDGR